MVHRMTCDPIWTGIIAGVGMAGSWMTGIWIGRWIERKFG